MNSLAQTTINETQWDGEVVPNLYLKDIDNNLDAFVGTFKSISNDTVFTIKLRKILNSDIGPYNEDLIIGELEYKIGNNFLINTLGDFNLNFFYQRNHHLAGGSTLDNNEKPTCNNCALNEKRLRLSINDNVYVSSFILKKTLLNGIEALLVYKFTQGPFSRHKNDPLEIPIIRDGNFIFIKQP